MKYLITGLGNPGAEYANTRHNIGFIVLDALIQDKEDVKFEHARLGDVVKIKFRGRVLVLLKPMTYMNHSGRAVKYWLDKEKIAVENSLTILDDIALPLGTLRMKMKGGDGSHNGLTSIIEHLKTTNFPRLRIGIGDDFARGYQSDFVLGQWTRKEEEVMIERIKLAKKMIQSFVTVGIGLTMTNFNNK